jgi:hypothetical protein
LAYAVDDGFQCDPAEPIRPITSQLQDALTEKLADHPLDLIWIEMVADVDRYIILGNIYPHDRNSVQLSVFRRCGSWCCHGSILTLEKSRAAWGVTDDDPSVVC